MPGTNQPGVETTAIELAQRNITDARARYLSRDPDDMAEEYIPFRGDVMALAAHYAVKGERIRKALE